MSVVRVSSTQIYTNLHKPSHATHPPLPQLPPPPHTPALPGSLPHEPRRDADGAVAAPALDEDGGPAAGQRGAGAAAVLARCGERRGGCFFLFIVVCSLSLFSILCLHIPPVCSPLYPILSNNTPITYLITPPGVGGGVVDRAAQKQGMPYYPPRSLAPHIHPTKYLHAHNNI